MNAEPALIKEVDDVIKKEQIYSSRNDFIRDAIRKLLEERKKSLFIRSTFKEIGEKAKKTGWNAKLPTREARIRIADEYLKESGLKLKR
jgi:Arc/MetJ-type ribon-helix-helix transcriptional regulator